MPKRIKHSPTDALPDVPDAPKAVRAYFAALGRKGGRLSGPARMAQLSQKQRTAIARKAARARWDAKKP